MRKSSLDFSSSYFHALDPATAAISSQGLSVVPLNRAGDPVFWLWGMFCQTSDQFLLLICSYNESFCQKLGSLESMAGRHGLQLIFNMHLKEHVPQARTHH